MSESKQAPLITKEFGSSSERVFCDDNTNTLKAKGLYKVSLMAADSNPHTRNFYEIHGFAPIGTGETIQVGQNTVPFSILVWRICSAVSASD